MKSAVQPGLVVDRVVLERAGVADDAADDQQLPPFEPDPVLMKGNTPAVVDPRMRCLGGTPAAMGTPTPPVRNGCCWLRSAGLPAAPVPVRNPRTVGHPSA